MKKLLSALMALMLVVSMFAMNVTADGATVYVSAEGKDVADGATGAKDNPFNNIIDAFSALSETGGTIVIVGTVKGDVKWTVKKTVEDEDGNVQETDEFNMSYQVMPAHKGTVVVTGADENAVLDLDITSTTWINTDSTIYRNLKVNFGSARIMFSSYAGHLVVEETCEFTGNPAGSYFYGTGTLEFYNNCGLAHGFANYPNHKPEIYKNDTVVVLGKNAVMGTIWGGLGEVVNNGAYIVKDNAAVTTIWGCGQASSNTASTYVYIKGGSAGTINAKGSNGTEAAKSFIIGGTGNDFKATAADWTATEVNENAALFNKVVKEYKVTGDVNSFVNVANVAEGTKLFAIVDGAAVEMEYCNTVSDGVFFSTVEGATNYVFADAVKVEEPKEDEPTSAPTGDNMAVFAILGAVALAGAFTFKKVR